ncbi:response regulator transcription factor [Rhizobium gallicum]|uniref:response regulator transcription factor n=1 Tax=Rhizobium gallicum TaxID=56730 RepID=UPI001EF8A9E1|nr:response regulator [Rhizobium gallicum]ULJ72994.1 response regulator [Rhizobium gallicum]
MAGEPLISIIDDDQAMRSALVRLIRSLGYVARGFASAEEFIEAGVMSGCSCVITDIQMPGMSGIHLTRLIAERQSEVPVILITARTEPGTRGRRPCQRGRGLLQEADRHHGLR